MKKVSIFAEFLWSIVSIKHKNAITNNKYFKY